MFVLSQQNYYFPKVASFLMEAIHSVFETEDILAEKNEQINREKYAY